MFANLIKNKITETSLWLFSTWLVAITTSRLLGCDLTSYAHLEFGDFPAIFYTDPLKLHQVGWACRWIAIFRSLQRCSIGFKSGLWLGHSRTFVELSQSQSGIVFALLRVIVLLGCVPVQSEVRNVLEQVFIKDMDWKQLNLGFIIPEDLVPQSDSPLGFFLQTPSGFHVYFTEDWLPSGHSAVELRLVECCILSGSFSHLH